jgi:hypothetical protein
MAIFWPTSKCAVDVTGMLVDPAGISMPVAARQRLPHGGRRAGGLHPAAERHAAQTGHRGRRRGVHRLHRVLILADNDLVAGLDARDAADINDFIPLAASTARPEPAMPST